MTQRHWSLHSRMSQLSCLPTSPHPASALFTLVSCFFDCSPRIQKLSYARGEKTQLYRRKEILLVVMPTGIDGIVICSLSKTIKSKWIFPINSFSVFWISLKAQNANEWMELTDLMCNSCYVLYFSLMTHLWHIVFQRLKASTTMISSDTLEHPRWFPNWESGSSRAWSLKIWVSWYSKVHAGNFV